MSHPRALARSTDPATSQEAADKVENSGKAATQRAAILAAVFRRPGSTAAELSQYAGLERHVASRRLPELRDAGFVETGEPRPCTLQGTKCITWKPARQIELFPKP